MLQPGELLRQLFKIRVHPLAEVEGRVGEGTRIWRWSHVAQTGVVGDNCMIGQGCYVAGIVGNNCRIQNGAQIFEGVTLEDDVFVGPNACFTNDKKTGTKSEYPVRTLVKRGATIGANATIICGVVVGENALVGAGAVVTKDVPAGATVVGCPARIMQRLSNEYEG